MIYGAKYWPIKKQHAQNGCSGEENVEVDVFREHLGVAIIENKIKKARLRWFGHVQRRPATAPVRKSLVMKVDGPPRGKG